LGHRREAVFSAAVLAELTTSAGTLKKVEERKRGKPPSTSVLAASSKNCE